MKLVTPFVVVLTAFLCGCGSSPSTTTQAPAGDFAIRASSQSVFVPIGFSSGSIQVSIVPANGFSQPVSVSVTGLPQGVTTTPSAPFTINPGSRQTVVFNAASNATAILQPVSLVATSGALTHTNMVSISVAQPVYAFVLRAFVSINLPITNGQDIYGFAIDANTGAITSTVSPQTGLTETPNFLTAATLPGGTFLFVLSATGGFFQLSTFKVDPATGSLTNVSSTDLGQIEVPWLAVHPSGKFLYTNHYDLFTGEYCTVAFLIDPQTASLTESSCSVDPSNSLVIPPPGNFAYATDRFDGTLKGYTVNQTDGSLALLQNVPSGQMQSVFVSDPQGRALYNFVAAASPGCQNLAIWTIDSASGSLAPLITSFGPLGCGTPSIAFTPADTFAFVPLPTSPSGSIVVGAVDPVTGNLMNLPGSPFSTASTVEPVQVEPSQGTFLIGLGGTGAQSYAIDPTTGIPAQTPASTSPFTSTTNFPVGSGSGFVVVVAK
jgi:Lactonase, 7-bladed beta-propeller